MGVTSYDDMLIDLAIMYQLGAFRVLKNLIGQKNKYEK